MFKIGCASILFCALAFASAQTRKYSNPYSLEYLVDSSDLVAFGKISKLEENRIEINPEMPLKGEAADKIIVDVHPSEQESKDLAEAYRLGNRVLWFLVRAGEHYRLDNIDDRSYGLTFSQQGRRIYLMTAGAYIIGFGSRLTESIRKEAALKPGRNDRSISIEPPVWYGAKTFTYPLDERIESLAHSWVAPRTGDAEIRLTGVRILRHFRSDENISILKALVYDSGKIERFGGKSDFKSEAAIVLGEWEVPISPAPDKDILDLAQIARKPIRVSVNGNEVKFGKDVNPPVLIDGHAYARVCSISEALGVKMMSYRLWSNEGVEIDAHPETIDMPFDSHTVWVGTKIENAPLPARTVRTEGFFPVRWVVEKLGGTVRWNSKLRRVEITIQKPSSAQLSG